MNSIDRRVTYKIVIDTETCPLDKDFVGVDPFNMWVYDVGYVVTDKRGTVYVARSFVVDEIFNHEEELMQSAYYAWKLKKYKEEIAQGTRIVANLYTIRKTLLDDMKLYEINEVYAHNMRFDYNTLNNTERWLTKSKFRYFFPYGTEICDTMRMAQAVIGKMPTYRKFCEENGYLTATGRLSMKAEHLFRFISKDNTFVESHTGLEDVLIEKEIMAYCYKQHKAMVRQLWG